MQNEIHDIANAITFSQLIPHLIADWASSELRDTIEGLQNRAGVAPAPSEVIDLCYAWLLCDRFDGTGNIEAKL